MDQHQISEAADTEVHVNIKLQDTPLFEDREHYDRQTEGNLAVRPQLQPIKIRHIVRSDISLQGLTLPSVRIFSDVST